MELGQLLILLLDFTSKEELKKGKLNERDTQRKTEVCPLSQTHTYPEIKFPTDNFEIYDLTWGAFVMLSKMETCF